MTRTVIRALSLMVTALLLFPPALYAAPENETIVLGVFPYLSANQIMEQLSPLSKRIEETLGKKVTMVSAPDFLSFVDRTTRGEYDLVLTAAHMGRLAQTRDGWKRVARSGQKTAAVLLVRKDSGIHGLQDLRGKKMAVGNVRSVTYLLAEEVLVQNGLTAGKDVKVIETTTFSNVVQSVFLREADVGATPTLLWDNWVNVNEAQNRELREIYRTKRTIPSFLILAGPRTDRATIRRLRESLLSFKNTPEGRSFFEKSRYDSFLPLGEATMKQIDPYVHVLLERKAEK